MARLINGINGPFIGKIGSVIGSSRNGNPYIKGPHKKRTKKVSQKELANRHKFSLAQAWLGPIVDFVRHGFKSDGLTTRSFITAKSYLLNHAMEGISPDWTINPSLVKVAAGDLALPEDIKVEQASEGLLKFTWNKADVRTTHQDDQVMLLAYDLKRHMAFCTVTGQFRKTGEDFLQIETATGHTYHIYLAFSAADSSTQSDSVYLGEINT